MLVVYILLAFMIGFILGNAGYKTFNHCGVLHVRQENGETFLFLELEKEINVVSSMSNITVSVENSRK